MHLLIRNCEAFATLLKKSHKHTRLKVKYLVLNSARCLCAKAPTYNLKTVEIYYMQISCVRICSTIMANTNGKRLNELLHFKKHDVLVF